MNSERRMLSDCIGELEKGRYAYCTNYDVFLELKKIFKDRLVHRNIDGIYELKLKKEEL